ncbi:MAG: OmpA family protein [Phaeodactylibacter sp.]|nr:OmpA family protein [Phaeodactylibacter sp.]
MRMRTWLLPALLLFLCSVVYAQPAKLKKANQLFEEGNYQLAIPIYEEILGREDLAQAKIRLAESFRFLGNYKASAQWYALVIGLPECRPEHKFYYGLMLLRTGDCEAAERWFKDYLRYHPYDPRKQRLLNACDYIDGLSREQVGGVTLSLPEFNSPNSELGPAYFEDGLVFSAFRRSEEDPLRAFLDLFKVTIEDRNAERKYSKPKLFSSDIQSRFHEGLAAFNNDETEIYFTRTRKVSSHSPLEPEIHRLEMVTARHLPQGGWSNFQSLPFNSDEYSVVHPSISSDGKRLFFSSDMPGGQGGKDLYLSFFENGRWGPSINLGPAVNTPDDEVFPFISDSGKLYFSSNGHLGLGGQDIFWTEEGYDGLWVLPHNLGAPFNSEADDFGVIFNSTEMEGYFTSNRSGGMGKDDIYFFQLAILGTPVQVDIVNLTTGDPVPYAKVISSCSGDTLLAGPDGRLFLRLPECCTLTGLSEGYKARSLEACERKGELAADTLFIALALAPGVAQTPAPEVVEEVMEKPFDGYLANGVVLNKESGKPVFQAKVRLTSVGCTEPEAAFTDKQGRFSLPMEEGCCYRLRIERENFFALNLDVCAKEGKYEQSFNAYLIPYASDPSSEGEGEGLPVKMDPEANTTASASATDFGFDRSPEGDRDEFAFRMNVYYDVNRTSVQKKSVSELTRLLQLLEDNPDIILEISSHTDSNGDSASNLTLSQKRADTIVRFLISKGIKKERLVAKGYGESKLANGCADGVPCSEEEHQENRRTEFRVLGKVQ